MESQVDLKYAAILRKDLGNDYLRRFGTEGLSDHMDTLCEMSIKELEIRLSKLID